MDDELKHRSSSLTRLKGYSFSFPDSFGQTIADQQTDSEVDLA